MKLLFVNCDMLRANLIRTFNSKIEHEKPFDEFLNSFGGTAFVNCYTVAPDSPRSYAAMLTSLYPKDNGCDHRLKWPGRFLRKDIEDLFGYLGKANFYQSVYLTPAQYQLGLFPSDTPVQQVWHCDFPGYVANILSMIEKYKSLNVFISLNDYHWAIGDYGATKYADMVGQRKVVSALRLLFDAVPSDSFDHVFLFSDHGMKLWNEMYAPKHFFVNDDRTRIVMVHRRKYDNTLAIDTDLRAILDIFPTVVDMVGSIPFSAGAFPMAGRSFFEPGGNPVVIEDHFGTAVDSFEIPVNLWVVRSTDYYYFRTLDECKLLRCDPNSPSEYREITSLSEDEKRVCHDFEALLSLRSSLDSVLAQYRSEGGLFARYSDYSIREKKGRTLGFLLKKALYSQIVKIGRRIRPPKYNKIETQTHG